ncbi:MAG: 50S ribosomal protein L10 [Oscillospiraceae bacterium]|nr:50S ribosomal protein L10 [Oscillospiraceae bacterium]
MPSEKALESKKQAVAELVEKLNGSVAGVVVEYSGVSVADDTKLRADLRAENVEYKVVKNSILKRAASEVGLSDLDAVLNGTTAIAISKDDHVAAARVLKKFADGHDGFNIKSGYMDGAVIDLATINSLAGLPSKDVLLATVCNAFNAPIAAFARVIQAVVDKSGEEVPAPAEEAAPAPAEEAPAEEAAE